MQEALYSAWLVCQYKCIILSGLVSYAGRWEATYWKESPRVAAVSVLQTKSGTRLPDQHVIVCIVGMDAWWVSSIE